MEQTVYEYKIITETEDGKFMTRANALGGDGFRVHTFHREGMQLWALMEKAKPKKT